MTATDTTTEAASTPTKGIDVLPIRGGKRIALEWFPHTEDAPTGGRALPLAGYVRLTSDRDRTSYAVTECPDEHGRSVVFSKVGGKGTDRKREWYVLRCDRDGTHAKCDCEGHTRHGHCKHADSLETLVANRWL